MIYTVCANGEIASSHHRGRASAEAAFDLLEKEGDRAEIKFADDVLPQRGSVRISLTEIIAGTKVATHDILNSDGQSIYQASHALRVSAIVSYLIAAVELTEIELQNLNRK